MGRGKLRLIPNYITNPHQTTKSEMKVFELIGNLNVGEHSVALHSYNIAGDERQRWYEIDFVVITNKAILIIEVKGGKVSRDSNGIWTVSDPVTDKVIYKKNVSPLHQAMVNSRKFEQDVLKKLLDTDVPVKLYPCVVLAGNHKTGWSDYSASNDLPDENTLYREGLTQEGFEKFIKQAILKAKSKGQLNEKQIGSLVSGFRRTLDRGIVRINDLDAEMASLTQEQYQFADMTMPQERVIIEGGAGTGKTFLALYVARIRASDRSKKIGFITSSLSSANELNRTNLQKQRGFFDILDIEKLEKNTDNYKEKFDEIIIDEGQHFCTMDCLEKFDQALRGGLNKGRWRWFGDPQNQVIEQQLFDPQVYEYLTELTGNNAVFSLKHNVRNTPKIVNFISRVTNSSIGEAKVRGFGPNVECLPLKNILRSLQEKRLVEELAEMSNETSLIAFLCKDADDFSSMSKFKAISPSPFFEYDGTQPQKGRPVYSTIEAFRGLETRIVVLLGLNKCKTDEELMRLLYLGVSRSKSYVFIEADDQLISRIHKARHDQKE